MTVLEDRPSAERTVGDTRATAAAQALFEEARERRRHRHRVSLGLTMALLIAAVTVFLIQRESTPTVPSKSDHGAPIAGSSVPPMPTQMVVWAQTSPSTVSIEVIWSKTGRVIRTLAIDDGLFRSTPQPAVSGLSGTVFFDDSIAGSSTPGPGDPAPREQIMSVPLAGGAASVVAQGHDPSVSPNGQFLAYQTYTDISDAPEGIVVRNLVTGTSTTWQFATNVPEISSGLSWSPDSRLLALQSESPVQHAGWSVNTGVINVTQPGGSLDDTQQIPLPLCPPPTPWASPGASRDMTWAGFLNAHGGLGVCHHAGLTQQDDWYQPVVVNLSTGRVVQRLPVIHNLIGGVNGFQVDPSGHYLAFIGKGRPAGGLYRLTLKGNPPRPAGSQVLVKNGVGSAIWVPSQS